MTQTKDLKSLREVEMFITTNKLAFLYSVMPGCSVCYGLLPQIEEMLKEYPEIKLGVVDASEVETVRGQYSIFTAPVLILFVEGKEYLREARIVHTQMLNEKINRLYSNVVDS